jgi:hypothetical protein
MDSSGDLAELVSLDGGTDEELSDGNQVEETVRRRERQPYHFLRKFDTTQTFKDWWKAEGSKGWMQKSKHKRSDGDEVVTYR